MYHKILVRTKSNTFYGFEPRMFAFVRHTDLQWDAGRMAGRLVVLLGWLLEPDVCGSRGWQTMAAKCAPSGSRSTPSEMSARWLAAGNLAL